MKLDLRKIIHVPGASAPFDFQLDLTRMDFFGARPITRPIRVQGKVTNRAGALHLDDIGTKIGEVLRAPRAGKYAREIENTEMAESAHG